MIDDIMAELLEGHTLEIADENATELERFLEQDNEDPTVFDNLEEELP